MDFEYKEKGTATNTLADILIPITPTKYHLFVSQEVYSMYLEIIRGNNTYSALQKKTGKTQPQIVEILQPLLKSGIIKAKPFTGVKGKPSEFFADQERLEKLFYTFLKESGFSEQEVLNTKSKITLISFRQFVSHSKNFLTAKTFVGLSERFFDFTNIQTNKNVLTFG